MTSSLWPAPSSLTIAAPACSRRIDGIERALGRGIGLERQVGDQQRPRQAARDAGGVVDDVVDGHRQRAVVALHHHAERIADQHQVDAVGVERAGEAGVVGGQHHQLAAVALGFGQRRHGPAAWSSAGPLYMAWHLASTLRMAADDAMAIA